MKSRAIAVDPAIMSGAPCFVDTRVPVKALFDYLDGGHPVSDFLEDFPTVTEAQVHQVLAEAREKFLSVAED